MQRGVRTLIGLTQWEAILPSGVMRTNHYRCSQQRVDTPGLSRNGQAGIKFQLTQCYMGFDLCNLWDRKHEILQKAVKTFDALSDHAKNKVGVTGGGKTLEKFRALGNRAFEFGTRCSDWLRTI